MSNVYPYRRRSAKSTTGCLISGGLACWHGCGATRAVTMKASTQSRHQRGRAADVILHHECPVALAPDSGSQERDRPSPSAGRAP